MVLRHKYKYPPSEYEAGDTVIVKTTKSGKKIKGKGKVFVTSTGEIVQRSGNKREVEYEVGKGTRYARFLVSMFTSTKRAEKINRQGKATRNVARESQMNKIDTSLKNDNFEGNDELIIHGNIFPNTYENEKKKSATKNNITKKNIVKRKKEDVPIHKKN